MPRRPLGAAPSAAGRGAGRAQPRRPEDLPPARRRSGTPELARRAEAGPALARRRGRVKAEGLGEGGAAVAGL